MIARSLIPLLSRQLWNPGRLAGLAATLLPAESRSRGLLWQNTAKTTPAVADGDPVRVAVCPYTAVEFTAPSDAARPLLWDEGGGKWSLFYDGVDDRLSTPASFSQSANAPFTLVGGVRFASVTSVTVIETGVNTSGQYRRLGVGTGQAQVELWDGAFVGPSGIATNTNYQLIARITSTTVADFSLNGSVTAATTSGTVALNAFSSRAITVGFRSAGAAPLSGRVAGSFAVFAVVSTAELALITTYLQGLQP